MISGWPEDDRDLLKHVILLIRLFLWLDSLICAWASSFRRGFMVTYI
jgi:hypothetical protein